MNDLLLAVCSSVAVSVLLKAARARGVDLRPAIAVNYLVALGGVLLCLRPPLAHLGRVVAVDRAARPLWLLLALLLPGIFWVLAESVRRVGVARTDAAQRLSLLLPLLAAFTVFGEAFDLRRGAGIALGLAAVVALLRRAPRGDAAAGDRRWPLLVLAGMGLIDILFKRVAQVGRAGFPQVLLLVFTLALVFATLAVSWLAWRGRLRIRGRDLATGLPLGALNLADIVFYIRAHQRLPHDPALVFAAMNIGVIVVGTLAGVLLFGERLGTWARAGLLLAVLAVVVLAG